MKNNLRKRKSRHEVADDVRVKKQNASTSGIGIDQLPDDMLVAILSRMSLKDAARTSVLSSRWRNLWKFTSRDLVFDSADTVMETVEFARMVNSTLDLHQGTGVDTLSIRFSDAIRDDVAQWFIFRSIERSITFAMVNRVQKFELDLSVDGRSRHVNYEFPGFLFWLTKYPMDKWLSCVPKFKYKHSVPALRSLGAFCSLRSLRLVDIDIEDDTVRYFLSLCPYLKNMCIRASRTTENLQFVDTSPNLVELEISDCCNLQSLEISATNLVSCTYVGKKISSPFKKVPNFCELTLGGEFCESFVYEPNKHSNYSSQVAQLVLNLQTVRLERKIARSDLPQLHALKRLELNIVSRVGRSLLFFISLIKASPHLHEFKIKIDYLVAVRPWFCDSTIIERLMPFPEVNSTDENTCDHKNLKVLKLGGYCGCESEEQFLVQLCSTATSLETVFIDTDCDYYWDHPKRYVAMYRLRQDGKNLVSKKMTNAIEAGATTRFLAKKHAEKLRSSLFPPKTKFVIT